jgi:tetratricopeptide (TPR) repeat protein
MASGTTGSGETFEAAKRRLSQALSADPRADRAYNELVGLLFRNGRRGEAERLARVALRVNPGNAIAHDLFGTILSERNELAAGEWHFRRALALGAPELQSTVNLALNLVQQGRTEAADELYQRAEALAPGDLNVLAHRSKLAELRGNLPRASALLDRAAAVASERDVNLLRARLLRREGRYAEALDLLESCAEMNGDGYLERGWLRDRAGRYGEAWSDWVEGKRRLAQQSGIAGYQKDAVTEFFGRLKAFFTRSNVALLPQAPQRTDAPQPVFVCGFPRSGTTLLEQILSSHPEVLAGGELTFAADFRHLANRLFPEDGAFPENLSRSWTADGHYVATLFRDYYLARAAQAGLLGAGRRLFIDKMPFNEMYLPLIRMAFPRAPIIRIVRHPLDVCVSMMSNHFTHGFNCGYQLADIAAHLAATSDLTGHYGRELGSPELVLRYEDIVAAQEATTRRLLEHAGLPFSEDCLHFERNPRYARTPSYSQVAETLNDRSVGRHRHYSAELAEVLPVLQPMASALGYRT